MYKKSVNYHKTIQYIHGRPSNASFAKRPLVSNKAMFP